MIKKSRSNIISGKSGETRNPFKGYQDERLAEREKVITRYIASLRRTRARFEYVTDLAKAVAEQLTLCDGAPCSYTTLLRNKRYKALLLHYMSGKEGVATATVSDPVAQAKLHMLELEVSNAKREIERLRAYITALEQRLDDTTRTPLLVAPSTDAAASADSLHQIHNEKALACKALFLVLQNFQDLISTDADRQCIVDLSAPVRKNIIVESAIAAPFFEWLYQNADIGR